MKKTLILCMILSLVALRSEAQSSSEAQSRGTLTLSLGPAIPLGDFASKDGTSITAGLANIGALADLSYKHPISNTRFGWLATLRGRFNGVNKNATLAPFEAQFPGYQQWSMNHSRWTTAAALIGGYYQLPLTPKLNLEGHIAAGVAECWSPKQTITGVRDSTGFGPTDLVQAYLHSVTATTFTALGGLGVSYRWRSRWSLMASADYMYLKPKFNNVTATLIWSQGLVVPGVLSPANARTLSAYSTTHDYTQPMPTVNIVVGVTRVL